MIHNDSLISLNLDLAIVHVLVLVLGVGPEVRLLEDEVGQLDLATVIVHGSVLFWAIVALAYVVSQRISVTVTTIVALTLPPTLGSSLGLAVLTQSYSMPFH
jgi:hypothetical protein